MKWISSRCRTHRADVHSSGLRWVFGAWIWASFVSQVTLTCSSLIGCGLCCPWLWQQLMPASPSHHLNAFPNFISTMGLSVGLNSTWLTQLVHVSTVVHASFSQIKWCCPLGFGWTFILAELFTLTVIRKNLSCSHWRHFDRCDKDYQDQYLVWAFDLHNFPFTSGKRCLFI